MSIKYILKRVNEDMAFPKAVIGVIYLEWKTLFLWTRNVTKEMFYEMLKGLIPGIDLEHKAVIELQRHAMCNFNNYQNCFNNCLEMLAKEFINAKNM